MPQIVHARVLTMAHSPNYMCWWILMTPCLFLCGALNSLLGFVLWWPHSAHFLLDPIPIYHDSPILIYFKTFLYTWQSHVSKICRFFWYILQKGCISYIFPYFLINLQIIYGQNNSIPLVWRFLFLLKIKAIMEYL